MKIEIGESLVYSWLRHSHNCQVCQLNWKTSEQWNVDETDLEFCQELMNESSILFGNPFKKTSNINQLIKQCEIDTLGIDTFNSNLFAVDIAYHTNGLGYKDSLENVTKKILRTVFAIILYFKNIQNYNIFFISPKIRNNLNLEIENRIINIGNFLKIKRMNINIELYSNEKFNEKILLPILAISDDVSDTSELFLRSYQMIKLFNNQITNSINIETNTLKTIPSENELKIGALVQFEFKRLIENNLLNSDVLANLQNSEYCIRIFRMNYPILKKLDNCDNINDARKINGYDRYYAKAINNYLLCNNWYENNRAYLNQWLLTLDI